MIYAKKTNKITKNLTPGLSLLLKIVENRKISRGFGLLSFNFFNFFKNYLGYLKIKEAADTLGMVCFCCNMKPFGWYVLAKNGIVKVPPLFCMVFERFSRKQAKRYECTCHRQEVTENRGSPVVGFRGCETGVVVCVLRTKGNSTP